MAESDVQVMHSQWSGFLLTNVAQTFGTCGEVLGMNRSECAMRREYRCPLFLYLCVLLQLLAFWWMQVMGGGFAANAPLFAGAVILLFYSCFLLF